MNSKHRKTLALIFKNPVPANILFDDVVALIISLGGLLVEGAGSRVQLRLNKSKITLHKPHPGKEIKRDAVRDIKNWLERLDITP